MRRLLILASAVTLLWLGATGQADEPIRFNRDIRPILSANCFACHGPNGSSRKGGLRLDQREAAIGKADSGEPAIVPHKPEASGLVKRIASADAGQVMPPPESNKRLTAEQKALLKRWIAEGAEYEAHWSFAAPVRPALPEVKQTAWPRNAIDWFILARLEREGLVPSSEADPVTLFRRLSLDLTGLPPEPADVDAFVEALAAAQPQGRDEVDAVYAGWVDRLLASPHYGERMAVDWLDAARFADTNGYQVDRDREMYAWRDWVIGAFNANMPFDQFTIEQIAGDLLPTPTQSQRIATGFHRNHMMNEEGGVIPEEFLVEYCADRVETTATLWLGQTFNCARCHDHKFDPFTQRDFYGLYAFYHNVNERGLGNYGASIRVNAPPFLRLPSAEQDAKISVLQKEVDELRARIPALNAAVLAGVPDWAARLQQTTVAWQTAEITSATRGKESIAAGADTHVVPIGTLASGTHAFSVTCRFPAAKVTALRLELVAAAGQEAKAPVHLGQWKVSRVPAEAGKSPLPLELRASEIEGSLPEAETTKVLKPKAGSDSPLTLKAGASMAVVELETALTDATTTAFTWEFSLRATEMAPALELRLAATDVEPELIAGPAISALAMKDAKDLSEDEKQQLLKFRVFKSAERRRMTIHAAGLTRQISELEAQVPTTLVMEELAMPRPTHILIRGAYDKKGDQVTAATPATLPPMAESLPRNRLGLARWLVDPANPLTPRVTVNRLWQSHFGVGLVRTSEDFGAQGEPPSHPELLDWLAVEFRDGEPGKTRAWDVKQLVRLIVTSSTYRQSSRLTPALRECDPENRLLARGPRFRLQAEFLRDEALAASGLLVPKIGGPSVKPYHPPGLYEQVTAGSGTNSYVEDKGENLFRRSLYTYWKRSVPHPSMLVFDAGFREACTVRRSRTNTPLQALNLMNDPTYVEASRVLGQRMLTDGGATVESRITWGFRRLLARAPRPAELAILVRAHERSLQSFTAEPGAATELLKVGTSPVAAGTDPVALAAMTTVATTILNLDEAVTRE